MTLFEMPIRNREELFAALGMLHDAACAPQDIIADPTRGALDITFERVSFDYPEQVRVTKRFWFFSQHEMPMVQSRLHIEGFVGCEVLGLSPKPKRYLFVECDIRGDQYTLEFSERLRIALKLGAATSGFLKDVELFPEKRGSFVE